MIVVLLIVISIWGINRGYQSFGHWGWTGLVPIEVTLPSGTTIKYEGKTLWDWLDLLIVPLVLAIGGFMLNQAQQRNNRQIADDVREQERQIAKDREEEAALQNYFDAMTELLLKENLRAPEKGGDNTETISEAQAIARSRTLTVVRRLNGERKASALQFLFEANLLSVGKVIVDISKADLRGADLQGAYLEGAILQGADLQGADLEGAILRGAILRGANLQKAILRRAILRRANLQEAYLEGADLRGADLEGAILEGAYLEGAYLEGADLQVAKLQEADLLVANLQEAILQGADLQEAILQGADLQGANLQEADLRGADLRGAYLGGADLRGADLSGADLRGARYNSQSYTITLYGYLRYLLSPTIWPEDFDPKAAGAIDVSE